MSKKQISIILVGATLIYAGVLSLADDLYVGVGMMIAGIILTVMPLWKTVVHFQNSSSGSTAYVAKTRKGKRKVQLRVVDGGKEDRPTYH